MAVLTWDETGKKFYETGVDRGVLFPVNPATGAYSKGVAWSGLTNVTETPSGAEQTDLYADNIKYLSLTSAETFEGKIEAYTCLSYTSDASDAPHPIVPRGPTPTS